MVCTRGVQRLKAVGSGHEPGSIATGAAGRRISSVDGSWKLIRQRWCRDSRRRQSPEQVTPGSSSFATFDYLRPSPTIRSCSNSPDRARRCEAFLKNPDTVATLSNGQEQLGAVQSAIFVQHRRSCCRMPNARKVQYRIGPIFEEDLLSAVEGSTSWWLYRPPPIVRGSPAPSALARGR